MKEVCLKVKVRVRRLSFGGTRVFFKVYTPDTEKISYRVAFVTSPLGDADSWDSPCRLLAAKGCLCVSIELPGFGHAVSSAPQDNKTRSEILWGILDQVEISRGDPESKWHLVSHGSACGAILEMTRTQPASVLSRVLITPVTHRFGYTSQTYVLSGLRVWLYRRLFEHFTRSEVRFSKKLSKLYGGDLDETRVGKLYRQICADGRFDSLLKLFQSGYYISKAAYKVRKPTMILWGRDDPLGAMFHPLTNCLLHPDENYERMNDAEPTKAECQRLGVETHNMKFRRHMPMETDPQDISDRISGWLAYAEGKARTPTKNSGR